MKRFLHILGYIRNYLNSAFLNVLFNILSVIFNLFSLTMIAPCLNLLFLKQEGEYKNILAKGVPELKVSVDSVVDSFNYYLSKIILQNGKLQALVFICVLVVSIILLKNIFRYFGMFFIATIRNGVVMDLRNAMYKKILALPLSYYSNERKGDLISRMTTDVQEIEWSVMQSLEMLFRNPISILIFLGTLIYMSPKLTFLMVVLIPVPAVLIGLIAKSLRRTSVKSKTRLGVLFSIIEETLGGLRIIKAFNGEKFMDQK